VEQRTAAPPLYIIANLSLIAWCLFGLGQDVLAARIAHACLNAVTVALLIYGFSRFVTWRHAYEDVVTAFVAHARCCSPLRHRPAAETAKPGRPRAVVAEGKTNF
jgi:hypothetical protein